MQQTLSFAAGDDTNTDWNQDEDQDQTEEPEESKGQGRASQKDRQMSPPRRGGCVQGGIQEDHLAVFDIVTTLTRQSLRPSGGGGEPSDDGIQGPRWWFEGMIYGEVGDESTRSIGRS
eukprot:6333278-Amphidinium_carterae.1